MGEPVNVGAGSGGPERLASIQAKVDEVSSLYKKVHAARSANRTARVVVVIAILVVVISFAIALVSFVYNYDKAKFLGAIQANQGEIMSLAQTELTKVGKNLLPVYKEEAKKSWPDVKVKVMAELENLKTDLKAELPTVKAEADALWEQVKAEMPGIQNELQGQLVALQKQMMDELPNIREKLEAEVGAFREAFLQKWPDIQTKLQSEADTFVKDVEKAANSKMQTRLQAIVDRQRAKLENLFPELKDDAQRQVVLTNLQTALQTSFRTVMTDRVASGKERIARLYAKILNFLPPARREGFQQRITTAWDNLIQKYQAPAPAPTEPKL